MGSWFSCKRSSSTSDKNTIIKSTTVRVVHLSGYVEDFEHPVLVRHVAVKPGKHFLCTATQLLSAGSTPIMQPDSELEPGRVYFLLPFSTLLSDNMSPMDLAAVARRLSARARNARLSSDPTKSPARTFGRSGSESGRVNIGYYDQDRVLESIYEQARSSRVRSWKPILDTIREMSFDHRRNESELLLQDSNFDSKDFLKDC